jgi:tripartite-type tricarboxylate transporter receptor subunit TctC
MLGAACAILFSVIPGPGFAGWKPTQAIRIIVPFAAGGPSDTIARIIAHEMADILEAPVYIDNISGGGGNTGVQRFLKDARDGHTLLMGHMGTHGAAPALNANLGYDPNGDFAPIGLAAGTPMVIAVAQDVAAQDLKELRELLRTPGSKLRIAHAGRGSASHAAAVLFTSALNVAPEFAAYSGTGPALNDLVNGQVDVLIDQIVNIAPVVGTRKARPLAIAGNWRSDALPDVPTTRELGVEMSMDAWSGLFAKKGTPEKQIATLNAALRYALDSHTARARLIDLGASLPDDATGSPDALAHLVKNEVARWSAALYELRN